MISMREAFFNRVFEYAKTNPDIIVLTTDFPGPFVDQFHVQLSGQFINTGISEQNTVLVAAGLAKAGKKVIIASIAAFISMRCYEQIRLYLADQNLDIKLVGFRSGLSYGTVGTSHHAVEDIALMRILPNMNVFLPSTNKQVEAFADWCCTTREPAYIRLDRMAMEETYSDGFTPGAGFHRMRDGETVIIANGYMMQTAIVAADELNGNNIKTGIWDLSRIPIDESVFCDSLRGVRQLISVEEHVAPGGVGSYLLEVMNNHGVTVPLRRIALDMRDGYYHGYGTRDEMHDVCGIGVRQIVEAARGVNA